MKRFVEGADRGQSTLLPECLDDWIDEENPVCAIDAFVDALDMKELGFDGVEPAATGRPAFHPSVLLKLYIYGYLNRVQSSRRLEREAGRNLELLWLLGRLVPDHKTIADFRKDNGAALSKVCARFVELRREMGLLATASVAIDGSKFKAVNNRDRNFTKGKVERRRDAIHAAGWVSLFTLHAIWPFLWIWAMLYRPDRGWGMGGASKSTDQTVSEAARISGLDERLSLIERRLSEGNR